MIGQGWLRLGQEWFRVGRLWVRHGRAWFKLVVNGSDMYRMIKYWSCKSRVQVQTDKYGSDC